MRLQITIASTLFGLSVFGCGATENQLRDRAAFDMKCTQDKVEIVEIDQRTRGVRACGQQATYVENCAQPNHTDCTWILNADTSKPSEAK
jgi:hypothetical protein